MRGAHLQNRGGGGGGGRRGRGMSFGRSLSIGLEKRVTCPAPPTTDANADNQESAHDNPNRTWSERSEVKNSLLLLLSPRLCFLSSIIIDRSGFYGTYSLI